MKIIEMKCSGCGAQITPDLTPLAGLKYIETLSVFMNRVTDVSPLANLVSLKNLGPLLKLTNLKNLHQ